MLPPASVKGISARCMKKIPSDAASGWTNAQVAQFSINDWVKGGCFGVTSGHFWYMTPSAYSGFQNYCVAKFPADSCSGISRKGFHAMTDEAREALQGDCVSYLNDYVWDFITEDEIQTVWNCTGVPVGKFDSLPKNISFRTYLTQKKQPKIISQKFFFIFIHRTPSKLHRFNVFDGNKLNKIKWNFSACNKLHKSGGNSKNNYKYSRKILKRTSW